MDCNLTRLVRIGLDQVTSGYLFGSLGSLSDLKSEELQGRKRGEGEQRGKLVAWIGLFYHYFYDDNYDVDNYDYCDDNYDYYDVDNYDYYDVDNYDCYDVDNNDYYDVDDYDYYDVDVDDEFA